MNIIFLSLIILLIPISSLALEKTSTHRPEAFIESLKNDPEAGKKVYLEFCAACHDPDPMIPLGAPRLGIKEDWEYHKQTIKEMLKTVSEGLNNMPARGGCFECSDELLESAIRYLVPAKNKSHPK